MPTPHLPFLAEEMKVYGPKAHQRVISKLTSGLGPMYYREGTLPLEPLPETMLNEGEPSPVPDLILYDNQTRTTPVVIEVCHTEGLRKDLRKVIGLIDGDEYGIEEGFVYDYLAGQWYCYRRGNGGLTETSSFSRVLDLDLNAFLLP
jgi:Uma2 family endonuclease